MLTSPPQQYLQRAERIERALRFEPVDRVPFLMSGQAYAAVSQGLSLAEYCARPTAALEAQLDCMDELSALAEVDGATILQVGCFPVAIGIGSLSRIEIPGFDLPDDRLWQARPSGVMSEADYDVILERGWPAYIGSLIPKIANLQLLGIHDAWMKQHAGTAADQYRARGYVPLSGGVVALPFEPLCCGRTMPRFIRDCHRRPELIKRVLDLGLEFLTGMGIGSAAELDVPSVWVGGWLTAPALVAPRIWDVFVWPYYLQIIGALHANGIRCVLHFDANWDREIHRLLELPRGACVLATDGTTDLRRAREILGDHMPVLGDVPAGLMTTGTPQEVRAYVRDLIRDLGKTGLVMNTGCDMPFNTPRANAEALLLATHEFGTA